MPFYSCNVPAGSLTDSKKDDLAKDITRIHVEVTGGRPDLVHVFYNELAAADSYTAGEPSSDTIITLQTKRRLMSPAALSPFRTESV